jgi:hypothetical protein
VVTVYWDSNFYVWLAREDDDEVANQCVDQLNELRVRHVVSLSLARELFSGRNRPEANQRLHARVTRLTIPPLELMADFNWDALLGPPQALDQFAQVLRLTDDLATEGHSHGLIAEKPLSQEQQERWNQANPQFASLVPNEQEGNDPAKAVVFARSLLKQLRSTGLDTVFDLDVVLAALDEPNPDLKAISETIFASLGEETVSRLEEDKKLQRSVTASDSRPLNLTLGDATSKQRKKLANTFRDADHMALFVEHADKIDFLQIDGAQMQQILKKSPKHRLAELGLEERCFSAGGLLDAVEQVRLKLNERLAAKE